MATRSLKTHRANTHAPKAHALRIRAVAPDSVAAEAGLHAGDLVLAVGGHRVRDSLDFIYRAAEETIRLRVQSAGGSLRSVRLTREPDRDLGLEFVPDPVGRCGNRCVFCFIDQNPSGLRRSLYVKDEDYRLSLLFGNYVTLTGLHERDLRRIIAQRLSPLYVSVHATDPEVRRRLLRCRGSADIRPVLERFARGRIRMHAQIVLVPGYNDGPTLDRTLDDLERLYPAIASVAIVPVGLTRHRERLTPLRRPTTAEARRLLAMLANRRRAALARFGTRLHFAADEIYLLAGRPMPRAADYEGFPQIENGVGLVRQFEIDLRAYDQLLPDASQWRQADQSRRRLRAHLVTGELFAPALAARMLRALERTGEARYWQVRVLAAKNDLFGEEVTVAGLLGGVDMVAALKREPKSDLAVLPPEAFNQDGLTLDGWTVRAIAAAVGIRVQVGLTHDSCANRAHGERECE